MAAAAAPVLVGGQRIARLATSMNEAAASEVSEFARRQLEKFGWAECVLRVMARRRYASRVDGHSGWQWQGVGSA